MQARRLEKERAATRVVMYSLDRPKGDAVSEGPSRNGINVTSCRRRIQPFRFVLFCGVLFGFNNSAVADTVSFFGVITQSTQNGTGPAVINPSLNNIANGDAYSVTLDFGGSIAGPGTYDLTGGFLLFSDPTALATEVQFGAISLTVTANGGLDNISLLGCLTTGSGCLFGNQLNANFSIPSANLFSQNAVAQPTPGLSPSFQLLEDDGVTDIQGSVTTFSSVPEPASVLLLCACLVLLFHRPRFAHSDRRPGAVR